MYAKHIAEIFAREGILLLRHVWSESLKEDDAMDSIPCGDSLFWLLRSILTTLHSCKRCNPQDSSVWITIYQAQPDHIHNMSSAAKEFIWIKDMEKRNIQ